MTDSLHRHSDNAPRPGEIIVDSQRTASLVRTAQQQRSALHELARVADLAADLQAISEEAVDALAAAPEFDHLPTFVRADESWADTLPPCIQCGLDVPWAEALLMPCSHVEDGEVTTVGIVHATGCPK